MTAQYRHSQPGYLMIIISLIFLVVTVLMYVHDQMPGLIFGSVGLFMFIFGYKLTVEIKGDFLRFWFGPGIFSKTIPLDRIVYCELFKGIICGWGIRITGNGWLYNVSGMEAVTIVLKSGKKMHIGTDEPVRLIDAINSAMHGFNENDVSVMWSEVKTNYLKSVEEALSAARHPRSFEILADVCGHMDSRFAELSPEQKTWENFQKIITEMGPPSEYAELISEDEKQGWSKLTKIELGVIGIMLILFGVSAYFYPRMPEQMATHWDVHGQVNGYMPKLLGLLITPGILMAIVIFAIVAPRVASVWANIEGFRRFFGGLAVLLSVFMSLIQYQMILWNIGTKINPLIIALPMTAAIIAWVAIRFWRVHRQN